MAVTNCELSQIRATAIRALFVYLFSLYWRRRPTLWETVIAEAMVNGEICVTAPLQNRMLATVYGLAQEVEVSVSVPELMTTLDAIATDPAYIQERNADARR